MPAGRHNGDDARDSDDSTAQLPSWIVGLCGVAAVASALFSILLFLNR
jgi:hypothetical protein